MTVLSPSASRILQAIDLLKLFDRRGAVELLRQEFLHEAPTGERWRSVAQLASTIGELNMSHEAARRYAATEPWTLERTLGYCRELTRDGLEAEALDVLETLPKSAQDHAAVLHFRGTVASQRGDFAGAEALFRQALARTPLAPQTWFTLSVIKTFTQGDPDLARMEQLKTDMLAGQPRVAAQFCYAMGKAYDDIGDSERAFAVYSEGAAIMQRSEPFAAETWRDFARQVTQDYVPEKLGLLRKSGCNSQRVIFVNGTPRSGTTLVEQILTSHSQVSGGAELNLLRAALIPAGDYSMLGALNYELRNETSSDPWGELGRDYMRMIDDRFGAEGRIVDKTLNHSRMAGLLLHTLPKAQMIWLRRNPEDNALSCFRTFFTAPMPWSWSISDIAAYFQTEDMLHAHWAALYPDRILTVPYEELTSEPQTWIRRILDHVGLDEEAQVFEPHKSTRSVMTASVAQVRSPISTARIGASEAYAAFTEEFRKAYYR